MKESAVECYSAIKTKKAFLIGERQVIQPHSTYIFATKTLDKLLKNVEFSENTQLDMEFIKKITKNSDQSVHICIKILWFFDRVALEIWFFHILFWPRSSK